MLHNKLVLIKKKKKCFSSSKSDDYVLELHKSMFLGFVIILLKYILAYCS